MDNRLMSLNDGWPSRRPGRVSAYQTSPCSEPGLGIDPIGMDRANMAHADLLHHAGARRG